MNENPVVRLQLIKNNGLYYANVNNVRAPRKDEHSMHSIVTEDCIHVLDIVSIDEDVTQA